jgi:two-component system sensor histidine kinase AlgZ
MPRLVLQPLLENAVLHGISRLPGGGEIEVELAQVGDELAICIRNPAPTPREGDILPTLDASNDAARSGNRHAQFSIAQRLRYAYGPRARMAAAWNEGYYQVDLRLPVTTASPGPASNGTGSKRTA